MNSTTQIAVGQEAVISHSGSWSVHYYFGYKVTKVTPSGQVVVQHESDGYERRFDAKGREMGKSSNYPDSIHFNVVELRAAEDKRGREATAAAAINAVKVEETVRGTWGKESMEVRIANLEALLAAAKAAVAAI
jgi:ABC-type transport system substrate-binding protein